MIALKVVPDIKALRRLTFVKTEKKSIVPCKSQSDAFKNLESLIKELRTNPSKDRSPWRFPNEFWRSSSEGEFYLNEEQGEVFFYLLETFAPDNGSPSQISRGVIDEMLSACIINALNFVDNASEPFDDYLARRIAEFKRMLNSRLSDWEIVGCLERIKVPAEGFAFGKVLFCNHSHPAIKFYLQSAQKTKESRTSKSAVETALPNPIDHYTFFKIFVNAGDGEAARQMAEVELELTLDAFNFFASFFYLRDRLPALCDHHKHERKDAVFTRKKDSNGFSIHYANTFFHDDFDPSLIFRDNDVSSAFRKVDELLRCPRNSWGERLISAIRWAGKGSITRTRENAFIFYAIALEGLLLGTEHKEQLAYKLRLRAAHLIGLKNSSRSNVRDRVSKLYSIRSKIVHCGSNKLAQSDLEDLRGLTQSCIIRLMSDPAFGSFSKEGDVENWFEERMMYGPESS